MHHKSKLVEKHNSIPGCGVDSTFCYRVTSTEKNSPGKQDCGGFDGNLQQAVPKYLSSFIIFFKNDVWMSTWRYVYMNVGARGGQKVASDSLELEFQDAMSCWRWC